MNKFRSLVTERIASQQNLMNHFAPELEERFTRYVQVETTSDENSSTSPSTAKQFDLLRLLAEELRAIGASEIELTDTGCLYATVPATAGYDDKPVVAFCAHVDTSPAFSGKGVNPLVHRNYDGSPIVLPDDPSQVIDPAEFSYLGEKVGDDIITASGTTLLGADDKAGVAIMMVLANHLLNASDVPHGKVRLLFTPDEEIGRGVVNVDLQQLGADVGYTLDGSNLGEVTYESFSADKAVIKITGVSSHPGYSKGVMVNAAHLASRLAARLPYGEHTPETTSGREGFLHLYEINGNAFETELRLILRAFELDELESYGQLLEQLCADLRAEEPRANVQLSITPQYRNMYYWLEKDLTPVDLAFEAVKMLGVEPFPRPIRGGTDGSRLTEMGLPTPNLFTGMQNFHGPLEWISLQDMAKSTQMCLNLVELWGKQ